MHIIFLKIFLKFVILSICIQINTIMIIIKIAMNKNKIFKFDKY